MYIAGAEDRRRVDDDGVEPIVDSGQDLLLGQVLGVAVWPECRLGVPRWLSSSSVSRGAPGSGTPSAATEEVCTTRRTPARRAAWSTLRVPERGWRWDCAGFRQGPICAAQWKTTSTPSHRRGQRGRIEDVAQAMLNGETLQSRQWAGVTVESAQRCPSWIRARHKHEPMKPVAPVTRMSMVWRGAGGGSPVLSLPTQRWSLPLADADAQRRQPEVRPALARSAAAHLMEQRRQDAGAATAEWMASATTRAPRSSGRTLASAPPWAPMGVRTAATMTASGITASSAAGEPDSTIVGLSACGRRTPAVVASQGEAEMEGEISCLVRACLLDLGWGMRARPRQGPYLYCAPTDSTKKDEAIR